MKLKIYLAAHAAAEAALKGAIAAMDGVVAEVAEDISELGSTNF